MKKSKINFTCLNNSEFIKQIESSIEDFKNKHSRYPKPMEFVGYNNLPSINYIKKRLDLKETKDIYIYFNIPVSESLIKREKYFKDTTKEQYIKLIKNFYTKHNKVPTNRDFKNKNNLPSSATAIKLFGSWRNAIKEAGLKEMVSGIHKNSMFKKDKSKEELLADLKKYNEEHLKNNEYLMREDDINLNQHMSSYSTYICKFQSIENLYKLIGFNYHDFNKKAYKDYILKKYLELCSFLGRTASSRDIDKYNGIVGCVGATTYIKNFGSIYNLQVEAGVDLSANIISRNMSEKEGLENLKNLYYENNKNISTKLIYEKDGMPSYEWYVLRFGSLKKACEKIGIQYNIGKYRVSDDVYVNSLYEFKFIKYLMLLNVEFTKENMYKDFIPNFNKKYRFDFKIGDLFIEIFGLIAIDSYYEKTKEKIKLCKENNLKLIALYPEDFLKDEKFKLKFNEAYYI